MNPPPLKYALLAEVVYFCCMAVAHYFGIKQPLLFVYYDTTFYAYQDKIISFAVVAYSALFYSAAHHRCAVPAALIVLGVTMLGLHRSMFPMHWHPYLTKASPPHPTGYRPY
jgi:hypothetical protein